MDDRERKIQRVVERLEALGRQGYIPSTVKLAEIAFEEFEREEPRHLWPDDETMREVHHALRYDQAGHSVGYDLAREVLHETPLMQALAAWVRGTEWATVMHYGGSEIRALYEACRDAGIGG